MLRSSFYRFLTDIAVDVRPAWMVGQEGEDLPPREPIVAEALIDEPGQGEVLWRVDGPPPVREIVGGHHAGQGEAVRIPQDVFSDVFPPGWIPVLVPRSLEGGKGEDLDVEAPGIGAPWNEIADVVDGGIARVKLAQDAIDDVRLDKGTVRGDAHDDVRATRPSGAVISIEDVVLATSEAEPLPRRAQRRHHVVGVTIGGGHEDVIDEGGPPHAIHAANQHGLARQVFEDLSRQSRASHAGLNDGDG